MKTCEIAECVKPVPKGRHCSMHAARIARHGDPNVVRKPYDSIDPIERFWSKVDRRGDDECWPWLGTVLDSGYGQFKVSRKGVAAHRYAYALVVGPIPEGLTIDHVWAWGCRRRDCVNPAHLEPVTIAENTARAATSPPTINASKAECPQGHGPYARRIRADNGHAYRECQECRNELRRQRRAAVRKARHEAGNCLRLCPICHPKEKP